MGRNSYWEGRYIGVQFSLTRNQPVVWVEKTESWHNRSWRCGSAGGWSAGLDSAGALAPSPLE
ncbi:hypothetical protein CALCODRAFT_275500 [Calocera cornea HHB12733]|uniref:Uncharacterized protein n=1 Tax=Calocera cornea HHB12733 TaxID=1353952 RepID=A0A165G2K0_9BASI|nr:hypothetical protein CALCODRAFT_275500 [Calocera cornea HHB12733]